MSLGKLTVNGRQDGFLCEGKPFFWFADTCWSAFTSITEADWDYYLTRRAEQGMNVLQINTLPQWDRCCPDLGIWPYASEDGVHFDWSRPNQAYWDRAAAMCRAAAEQGMNVLQINTLPQWDRCCPDLGIWPYASEDGVHFDWSRPNQAYWDRAAAMCRAAVEHGIRPALVLMWCNYVPGTWGAKIAERCGAEVMPREEVRAHVARVVESLGEFDPVYVVTGDTDFTSDEAIAYYENALDEVVKRAPEALRTMHINRGNRTIPSQYLDRLDFYMFQPGHNYEGQPEAWRLPQDFIANYPKKPMVNSEPCYEQMGASRNVYWRFTAQDCRASVWSSILAGASAGVTYGAHGVWNWQTSKSQGSVLGEGFDMPFRWQECLQFAGVWDFGAIEHVLAGLGATAGDDALAVVPAQELLDDAREAIRVARVGDRVVTYLPRTTALKFKLDGARDWTATVLDMEGKRIAKLPVRDNGDGTVRVAQHPFEHDALVILAPGR